MGPAVRLGRRLFALRGVVPVPLLMAMLVFHRQAGALALVVGTLLVALGEGLRLWGVAHIGSRSRTRGDDVGALVTSGPFRFSRNPLYVGNLLMWAGVAVLVAQPWVGATSLVLLGVHYRLVVAWEEHNIAQEKPSEYFAYREGVARWWGQPAQSSAGAGELGQALRSEKSTFIALAAVLTIVGVVQLGIAAQ